MSSSLQHPPALVRATDVELGRDADTGGAGLLRGRPGEGACPSPTDVERVGCRDPFDPGPKGRRELFAAIRADLPRRANRPHSLRAPPAIFAKRRFGLISIASSTKSRVTSACRSARPTSSTGHYADAGLPRRAAREAARRAVRLHGAFAWACEEKARLASKGEDNEQTYRFTQRIEAEERAVETAALVIASTRQEVREQYELYDHYQPDRMQVIPPASDLSRFSPPGASWARPAIAAELDRFLTDPRKPMVLALARADERKNFEGLVRAFGETEGTPGDGEPDHHRRQPRRHRGDECRAAPRPDAHSVVDRPLRPSTARWPIRSTTTPPTCLSSIGSPRRRRALFVNPALTEPFGLTLLEAAATGLPLVATNDGGPQDIIGTCKNGLLVDVLDSKAIGEAIRDAFERPGALDPLVGGRSHRGARETIRGTVTRPVTFKRSAKS